jgi:hypothetical protein
MFSAQKARMASAVGETRLQAKQDHEDSLGQSNYRKDQRSRLTENYQSRVDEWMSTAPIPQSTCPAALAADAAATGLSPLAIFDPAESKAVAPQATILSRSRDPNKELGMTSLDSGYGNVQPSFVSST